MLLGPPHFAGDLIPIARPKFINCPPPLGSPRFARGAAKGAPTRFPLRAGGTLRRGSSTAVFCELWLGDWYYSRHAVCPDRCRVQYPTMTEPRLVQMDARIEVHQLPPSYRVSFRRQEVSLC